MNRVDPGLPAASVDRALRAGKTTGGSPSLLFRKNREAFLNDRDSIDKTGASAMGATINAYLSEYAADGYSHVYLDAGSVYLIDSTGVSVPAGMVLEGPHQAGAQGLASGLRAEFKATTGATNLVTLAGNYAALTGLRLNLNNIASVVGVRPNKHIQRITNCLFSAGAATATGIKGGGILYLGVRDCVWSDGFLGRGIDLLDAYADNPASVYYGVNVGWFERLIVGAAAGGIRAEGIFTIRDCDFEAAYSSSAIEVNTDSTNSYAVIESNYFELTGTPNIAIDLHSGASYVIANNVLYGASAATSGGAGVKFSGYGYRGAIRDNSFNRFETGILGAHFTTTLTPGATIADNSYSIVTTPITWFDATPTTLGPAATVALQYAQDPNRGHLLIGGAVAQQVIAQSSGADLNLLGGNLFSLSHASPTTIATVSNAVPGMFFAVQATTANVTLANATFHLKESADTALATNEVRLFIVGANGNVRQVTG